MASPPSIATGRAARGVARLVIVLFAVAGVALAYGTGRSPAIVPCTAHVLHAVAIPHAPSGAALTEAPQDRRDRHGPSGDVVPLAALVLLLALGLAAPRTATRLRPPRPGPTAPPPPRPCDRAPSLAFLQVLRL